MKLDAQKHTASDGGVLADLSADANIFLDGVLLPEGSVRTLDTGAGIVTVYPHAMGCMIDLPLKHVELHGVVEYYRRNALEQ